MIIPLVNGTGKHYTSIATKCKQQASQLAVYLVAIPWSFLELNFHWFLFALFNLKEDSLYEAKQFSHNI